MNLFEASSLQKWTPKESRKFTEMALLILGIVLVAGGLAVVIANLQSEG